MKPKNVKNTEPKNSAAPLDDLHARLAELAEEAKVIENTADGEKRQMTTEEVDQVKKLQTAFREVEAEIAAREAASEMNAKVNQPGRRQTQPIDAVVDAPEVDEDDEQLPRAQRPRIEGGLPSGATRGKWGFRSLGEFAIAAIAHKAGNHDRRILNAPATFGSEGQNQDGGFAVPPDFRQEIMKQVLGEESLLSRCDQMSTNSNALALPLDTVSPWDTSNGVTTSWTGEGAALNATKPKLGQLETKLNKLTALVPLTDEILEDVPAMTRWLEQKVPDKITSALNTAIINGSGVGQPLGLLSAGAKITQAAESGQGANTVTFKNIVKMWGRLYARLRQNAIWLINQDVESQLQQMVVPGASPAFPAYLPPGGLNDSPYGRLMGRPVLPLEACSALGTEGDIILTDPTQYLVVMKAQGLRTDVSIHLYFDSDHVAFRFIMRVGGQPYWPAPITRQNGTNTLSSIVSLNSNRT